MKVYKRILSLTFALIMCVSGALAGVSAEEDHMCQLNPMYKDVVFNNLGWDKYSDIYTYSCEYVWNSDGSPFNSTSTPDYALIVAHDNTVSPWEYRETIGNYRLYHASGYSPFMTGYVIYSFEEDKIYSIREAWNNRINGVEKVLGILGAKVSLYAEEFEEYLEPYKDPEEENSVYGWYYYEELYYYDTDTGGTTEIPEATPDYVLVDATAYHCPPANVTEVIGDYVVYTGWGIPNDLSYYVYTPKDDKIFTLREAYDAQLQGIMNVFTDYGTGFLLGDTDRDKKLTIKDATYIQKALAKIEEYPLYIADEHIPDWVTVDVADFDLNAKINIKDATAIQKKLANIEE